jgi:hypothetical protein
MTKRPVTWTAQRRQDVITTNMDIKSNKTSFKTSI